MKTIKQRMSGFTLIELVVVISIIGLLAAMALPRFINLQREARIAKLSAVRGSVGAASALVHSAFLTKNNVADANNCPGTAITANNTTTLCTESGVIAIINGYPASTAIPAVAPAAPGVVGAAGLTTMLNPAAVDLQAEGYEVVSAIPDTTFRIQGATTPANCQFVYTHPTIAGAAPVISVLDTTGC